MPERNHQEETEMRLKGTPKDPLPDGEGSDPIQPGVVDPKKKGDDDDLQ